ncbi:bacteriohemerythrin [candidate division KSB1 bacterium]
MPEQVEFVWDASLETKIPWIDTQHKKLLENLNALLNIVTSKKNYSQAGHVLSFLTKYVKAHFGTEEQFMLKYGYHQYGRHKKKHDEFIVTIAQLNKAYYECESSDKFAIKLLYEFWRWYKQHINKYDRAFAEFLKLRKAHTIDKSAEEMLDELLESYGNEDVE